MSKTKLVCIEQTGFRLGWVVVTDVPEDISNDDIKRTINTLIADDFMYEVDPCQFDYWQPNDGAEVFGINDFDARKPDKSQEYVMSFNELVQRRDAAIKEGV